METWGKACAPGGGKEKRHARTARSVLIPGQVCEEMEERCFSSSKAALRQAKKERHGPREYNHSRRLSRKSPKGGDLPCSGGGQSGSCPGEGRACCERGARKLCWLKSQQDRKRKDIPPVRKTLLEKGGEETAEEKSTAEWWPTGGDDFSNFVRDGACLSGKRKEHLRSAGKEERWCSLKKKERPGKRGPGHEGGNCRQRIHPLPKKKKAFWEEKKKQNRIGERGFEIPPGEISALEGKFSKGAFMPQRGGGGKNTVGEIKSLFFMGPKK